MRMLHSNRMRALIVAATMFAAPCLAGVVDFEGLPDAYFFSSGGQNIGTFYSGLTFGPNVTGLSVSRFGGYDDSGFPPHSGDVAIWDAFDSTISINFSSPTEAFGIWYSSIDPLTLDAIDQFSNPLGEVIGSPNTDGTTGTSSFLAIFDPGITTINLTSSAGQFVLDDLATGTDVVPEPSSFALALPLLLLFAGIRGFNGLTWFQSKPLPDETRKP